MGRLADLGRLRHPAARPGHAVQSQQLRFLDRVHIGDTITASVRCIEKRAKPLAIFETRIVKSTGAVVAEGIAEINVPTERVAMFNRALPTLILDQKNKFFCR